MSTSNGKSVLNSYGRTQVRFKIQKLARIQKYNKASLTGDKPEAKTQETGTNDSHKDINWKHENKQKNRKNGNSWKA